MNYKFGDKIRVVNPRPENDFEYSCEKYKGEIFSVINKRKYDDRVYVKVEGDKTMYLYFDEIELEVE